MPDVRFSCVPSTVSDAAELCSRCSTQSVEYRISLSARVLNVILDTPMYAAECVHGNVFMQGRPFDAYSLIRLSTWRHVYYVVVSAQAIVEVGLRVGWPMVWAGSMPDWFLLRPVTNYLETKGLCCTLAKTKKVVDTAGTTNTVVDW